MRMLIGTVAVMMATAPYASTAETSPRRMIRTTVSWTANNIPHDSFAERPKTMTRAGSRYCRIDLEMNPGRQNHQSSIINEPDLWDLDRVSMVAKHYVDPGPTFNCRLPIFGIDTTSGEDIRNLEFGRELEFFRARRARVIVVGGRNSGSVYELPLGHRSLRLEMKPGDKAPEAIELAYAGRLQRVKYIEWNDQLPFDPALFAEPRDAKIEEGAARWSLRDWIRAFVNRLVQSATT